MVLKRMVAQKILGDDVEIFRECVASGYWSMKTRWSADLLLLGARAVGRVIAVLAFRVDGSHQTLSVRNVNLGKAAGFGGMYGGNDSLNVPPQNGPLLIANHNERDSAVVALIQGTGGQCVPRPVSLPKKILPSSQFDFPLCQSVACWGCP